MPDSLPADPIAQLRQSIASLEEQQRALGVNLSASIQPLRELLAQLEQGAGTTSISNVSGGIAAEADRIDVGGDMVGRDKVESRIDTVTASNNRVVVKDSTAGDTLINSTKITYAGDDPAANQALLSRYLKWVVKDCAPLKLTGIDQGAAHPGQQPLGLANVYVDLNLDLKIHTDSTFADHLREIEILKHNNHDEIRRDARATRSVS